MAWKSNEGQTILWNYSIAMWFLHSLCIVLYITVIICIYSSNGQITHFSGTWKPIGNTPIFRHSISLFRDFEKASDLAERPKECVNRLSSPYRGAQSPVIYQCACQWFGNTLLLSVIKFQMCGNFFNAYSGQFQFT